MPASLCVLLTAVAGQLDPIGPPQPTPMGSGDDIGASEALDQARAAQLLEQPGGLLTGGLGFERIGEDYFLRLELAFGFDFDSWGIGLQMPVRLRIIDNPPQEDGDLLGVIRREDWDTVADVLRFVRYVYVGQRDRRGPYYLRLGQLFDTTLGHGTLVHRYRNDVDVNRWRVGFEALGRYQGYGAHAFVGDLTEPYLSGLRATVRPLELILGKQPLMGLEVGTSLVVDARAPVSLCQNRVNEVGDVDPTCLRPSDVMPGENVRIGLDAEGLPAVAEDRALVLWGLDVGYDVVSTGGLLIRPYIDFNLIAALAEGWGFHTGILWQFRFPALIDTLVIDLRTEYRAVAGDYMGPYVNSIYEIERFRSLRTRGPLGPVPKFAAQCQAAADGDCRGGDARQGYFLELLAGFPRWVFLGGELLQYSDGPDGTFRLSLEVPALQVVQFRASYFRVNVADLGDLFEVDERSAVVARARVPVWSIIALDVEWSRVWRGDPLRGYEPVDDWRIGAGFALPL